MYVEETNFVFNFLPTRIDAFGHFSETVWVAYFLKMQQHIFCSFNYRSIVIHNNKMFNLIDTKDVFSSYMLCLIGEGKGGWSPFQQQSKKRGPNFNMISNSVANQPGVPQ